VQSHPAKAHPPGTRAKAFFPADTGCNKKTTTDRLSAGAALGLMKRARSDGSSCFLRQIRAAMPSRPRRREVEVEVRQWIGTSSRNIEAGGPFLQQPVRGRLFRPSATVVPLDNSRWAPWAGFPLYGLTLFCFLPFLSLPHGSIGSTDFFLVGEDGPNPPRPAARLSRRGAPKRHRWPSSDPERPPWIRRLGFVDFPIRGRSR